MREIKFRALIFSDDPRDYNPESPIHPESYGRPFKYKGHTCFMYYWNINFFADYSPVTGYGDEFPDEEKNIDEFKGEYTFVLLMQYTGLKDKNGKEIYEGDLIQFDQYTDDRKIYQVKYDEYYARFLFDWWGTYYELYDTGFYPREHGEIIGNIYENSELLK